MEQPLAAGQPRGTPHPLLEDEIPDCFDVGAQRREGRQGFTSQAPKTLP
ncbi:MAG: hypothetical protein HC919_00570 [Oscillatoriales cyanobacterium SM2_2_1]|nr:hypothetical protein [Oscillatoriales cyanobacterium SM2_2_1]